MPSTMRNERGRQKSTRAETGAAQGVGVSVVFSPPRAGAAAFSLATKRMITATKLLRLVAQLWALLGIRITLSVSTN